MKPTGHYRAQLPAHITPAKQLPPPTMKRSERKKSHNIVRCVILFLDNMRIYLENDKGKILTAFNVAGKGPHKTQNVR